MILICQRKVRGSEGERDTILPRFTALRLWSGCASLFFTLNPHDIRSPITLTLLQGDSKFEKVFYLDETYENLNAYVKEFLHDNPRRLHGLVARNQLVATRCFHWTVRLVIRTLFNCADLPGVHLDNIAANEIPGVFGSCSSPGSSVNKEDRLAIGIAVFFVGNGVKVGNLEDTRLDQRWLLVQCCVVETASVQTVFLALSGTSRKEDPWVVGTNVLDSANLGR